MDRIRLQTDLYGAMTNDHELKTMRQSTNGKDRRYSIIDRCCCQPATWLRIVYGRAAPHGHDDVRRQAHYAHGAGIFRGTIGLARYLVSQGAQVTVTDVKPAAELQDSVAALHGLPVRFVLGRHELEDFTDVDMVFASPAVRQDSSYLIAARARVCRLIPR